MTAHDYSSRMCIAHFVAPVARLSTCSIGCHVYGAHYRCLSNATTGACVLHVEEGMKADKRNPPSPRAGAARYPGACSGVG